MNATLTPARQLPGPRGREARRFLGIGSADGMVAFFAETVRRYGPLVGMRFFGHHVVLVDDADLIAEVLQHQQHAFSRDTGAVLLRELVGDSLLTSEDPAHLVRRRMLQPAFHRARIRTYTEHMVDEARRTADAWEHRTKIDIGGEMAQLTLGVVGRSLFGTDVRDEAHRIAAVVASIGGRGGKLQPLVAALSPLLFAIRRATPQTARFIFRRERQALEAIVDPIVARRRANGGGGDDLLAMLLDVRDDEGHGLSDIDVRNELITFVLAGHETTASALTWSWYLLASHPDAEARMHEEIDTVLGGRPPQMEDVPHLRYTAAEFDEALRLYPPAAAFGRRPLEPIALGGYRIPRGASIFVSPYVTQRNPRYFPDPDRFAPERWFGEPPPKFAFFPFGGGSKMCIGEPFARAEGVLVLATIAQRWRLRVEDVHVGPGTSALLRPAHAIRATLEVRAANAAQIT